MKKKYNFLISFIIALSMLISVNSIIGTGADTTLVWIGSDPHLGVPFDEPINHINFDICIADAIAHDADYAFCLGDNIHGDGDATRDTEEWNAFWTSMNNFTDIKNDMNRTMNIGNHDVSWGVNNNNRSTPLYFTVEVGNVLFIMISDLSTSGTDPYGFGLGWYNQGGVNELAWVKTTVQDNPDKNIIIMAHYPPYGSTAASTLANHYAQPKNEVIDLLNWFDNNGYPIAAWFHGHTHCGACTPVPDNTIQEVYGTTVICGGNAGNGHCEDMATDYYYVGRTAYLYFENGNTSLLVRQFDSNTSDWCTCGEFPHTITLNYAFEGGEVESIEFISIDGGTNGTTIYNSTPTFNWTIVSSASTYWLQIANDSAFTDLVVNLSDINEYNYPSKYNSNETRVSFILPVANSLDVIDKTYYCRVRSYT